ncbi:MAG: DUF2791 family P-loop domain-containing protein [Anaerolineae bacterium]|nr:DUF2791 family P-loop domain-containing protein [Anaerolineae bacterium]
MSIGPTTVTHTSTAPAGLRARLLGTPSLEVQGKVLDLPRRQVRALLFRLAAEGDLVPREQLAFLFWPDIPETKARRKLTHLLSHLRRALPNPNLILTIGDRVGLDPHRSTSDLATFERLAARVDDIPSLQRAAALYRGSFLSGFSLPESPEYEAWLLVQQQAYEGRYLGVLSVLIDAYADLGDHGTAIATARLYLATDALAEAVHRRLILLYAAAGDRPAALRQFERCAAILERELGVRPLPETRAAYESVLQHRPPPVTRTPRELVWTTLPSLAAPLIGRDVAMQALQEALADAEMGQGSVVLVSGEPGIGKSRLLEAFATRARRRALVLAAAARSVARALPYQPVAEAIRTLTTWEPLTTLLPVWLAEAARVLPELRQLRPDLPMPLPLEPQEARTRLLEALCRLFLHLADGPMPLLLCLDDLQRADSATLDWLIHLAPRIADRRMLIVATYRDDDSGRVERLRRSLSRVGRRREVPLSGLTREDTAALVGHALGAGLETDMLSSRLYRATGGNPFFLLETLRVLVEAGPISEGLPGAGRAEPLTGTVSDALPLPDSVREATEARLRRLSPATRQILEAGAILADVFDFPTVQRVAGRGETEAADGLEEAVARQLLEPEGEGYRFHHALIQQAVAASLSPLRRHLLHRRAARTLGQREPAVAGRIAHHFDLGGEAEQALHYYEKAANAAQTLFAWEEVEELQDRMLALLDALDPAGARADYRTLRGRILTERAHIRFLQGRLEARDADLAALTDLAEATDDDPLRLLTALHRVRYHNLSGDYAAAIAAAETNLPLAQHLGDAAAEARLLAYAGFAHYFLGQPEPAIAALDAAIAAAGDEMDARMRGRISHFLGYVYYHLGDYPRSLNYHCEAYGWARKVGDQNRIAWNLMDVGFLHLKLGEVAEARDWLVQSLALARRIAARPAEAYALTLLADWELYRGSYVAALNGYQESLALQEAVGSQHGILAAEDGVAFARYHLGDLDAARDAFCQALDRARAISHQRHMAQALIGLALVELDLSDLLRKTGGPLHPNHLLDEALSLARASRCAENEAMALVVWARLRRRQGDPAAALQYARQATKFATDHDLPACVACAEVEVGRALLSLGESEAACGHTTRALALLPRAHEGWMGTEEIHRAHAETLQALGSANEAHAQAELAEGLIHAKADRIADPALRRRYLRWVNRVSR